ncbi:hypothetical protein HID58_022676, partial [Brassica napus]
MRNEYGAISTVPEKDTYNKAEVDELVADINGAMRTTYDYHSKRLDDVYHPFNNKQSPSIDRHTRPSIDSDHTSLRGKLVTEKFLHDKLDEITFSQDLLKEDIYQELKDISESTHARFGMQ